MRVYIAEQRNVRTTGTSFEASTLVETPAACFSMSFSTVAQYEGARASSNTGR